MRFSIILFVVCLLITSCGGLSPSSSSPSSPSNCGSIQVLATGFLSTVSFGSVGETILLFGQNTCGFVPNNQISWQTSNNAVATVSSAGLVTAVGSGQTSVSGAYQGNTGIVQVIVNFARVVPVFIGPFGSKTLRLTFQGQTISAPGYYVFNLQPGSYELSGTFLSGPPFAVAFSTFRGLGNPPPISDNGVQFGSISGTGPGATPFPNNCEIDFSGVGDFRILFTVTSSRASGATCPPVL